MTSSIISRSVLALTFVLLGLTQASWAVTLADLDAGAEITVLDKRFTNWVVIDGFPAPPTFDRLGLIDVLPLADQPNNPGLQYNANGALSTTGLDPILLTIQFNVSTIDGSAIIKDNSLSLDDFEFGMNNLGFGSISIEENVWDPAGNPIGAKVVDADSLGTANLFDSVDFAPQSSILVDTTVLVSGDSLVTAGINSFSQRFSQLDNGGDGGGATIPEPASLFLSNAALMALGFSVRRRTMVARR